MLPTEGKLAALIGSRICHDLISPIGAINNGLELLTMTRDTSGPEIDLIAESVSNASNRIRFFRIAFGAAGEQPVGCNDVRDIIAGIESGRVKIHYHPEQDHARKRIRLVFLGILCLEAALPYGGTIDIAEAQGQWLLKGVGEKLNFDSDLWSVLADPTQLNQIEPAHVQFALLPTLLRDDGLALHTDIGTNQIELRF